ncbi:GNAT family N-acetyltransferase [Geobacillus stearothermophilus]|uniref:GNAT family N-acetyltransferase n=1 Tax=Geobacillus stearothermophilus TaxID=1422 RepID=UPI003D1F0B2D
MGSIQPRRLMTASGRSIVVRTASPEDAERVVAFVKAVAAEAPYLLTTEAEVVTTSERQKQWLQQMADDPGKLALLAEHDGEMIGFLDFHNGNKRRTKHQGSFGMSVKNGFRGQGIGTALLAALLDWAKENPLFFNIGHRFDIYCCSPFIIELNVLVACIESETANPSSDVIVQ